MSTENKEMLPSVAGRRLQGSNVDFERSCLVVIQELQNHPAIGSHIIHVLCEAVRCVREYTDRMNAAVFRDAPSHEVEKLRVLLREAHTQIYNDHGGLPEASCPTCQLLARIEEAIK